MLHAQSCREKNGPTRSSQERTYFQNKTNDFGSVHLTGAVWMASWVTPQEGGSVRTPWGPLPLSTTVHREPVTTDMDHHVQAACHS